MPTLTTHSRPATAASPTLDVALDLGNRTWCLACAPAVATPPRLRILPARDLTRLSSELVCARAHFAMPTDAPVLLCYEAGRDGFWLQRACTAAGITALVVDSSSIEVSRRKRRAKTDRLDTAALLAWYSVTPRGSVGSGACSISRRSRKKIGGMRTGS